MKRIFVTALTLAFALAMAGNAALAQQKQVAASNAPDAQFFPLEDVKPGMKGIALDGLFRQRSRKSSASKS